MAVRSPLEKAVFMDMVGFLRGLNIIEITNIFDNYPLVGLIYTLI